MKTSARNPWRGPALLFVFALLAGPAVAQDSDTAKARTFAETTLGSRCSDNVVGDDERFEFRFRYSYENKSDPEHVSVLYHLNCGAGAYNLIDAYVLRDEYDDMSVLSFAQPTLDIKYENDDFEGKVQSIKIIGYEATQFLINSQVDPKAETIISSNKWRGLGDAWSSGTWHFHQGRFILVKYEVDPTYDGEETGTTIYEAAR